MRFIISICVLALALWFSPTKANAHAAWSNQSEETAEPFQDWRHNDIGQVRVVHRRKHQIAAHAPRRGSAGKKPVGKSSGQHAVSISHAAAPEIIRSISIGELLEGVGDWFAGMATPAREPRSRSAVISTHDNLARVRIADGQIITVASRFADRFIGFFAALFQREGRLPGIGCRENGHQRNSLHHWGGACDVGQSARNVAWRAMYHVTALAEHFGLEDGCTWHRDPRGPDCGHIQVPQSYNRIYGDGGGRHYARARSRVRYAYVHRHWRYHQHRLAGA